MTNLLASFINAADPTSPLDIAPVAGRIGAEVRGIALSGDLDGGTIAAIRTALSRHKVLFFRDQTELDDTRHEAFAGLGQLPAASVTGVAVRVSVACRPTVTGVAVRDAPPLDESVIGVAVRVSVA